MEQTMELQKGQKAIVLTEDGHFFAQGAEIVFRGMDTIGKKDIYIFKGQDKEDGGIISQGLFYGQFQLI